MKTELSKPTGIRFSSEDRKIMEALRRKLGIKPSEIVRLAIRKLAEVERIRETDDAAAPPAYQAFQDARGIARDLFRSLGGGQQFIKAERAAFAASVRPVAGAPRQKK